MKKNLQTLFLIGSLVLSITACGNSSENLSKSTNAEGADTNSSEVNNVSDTASERSTPLTIRWGSTGNGTDEDMQWLSNSPIMDYVTEQTNGMIQFEYYPSSQLGGEAEMLDQVLMGTLDMCVVQPSTMSTVWPELTLMTFPFAYPDLTTYWDTWNNDEMRRALKQIMDDKAIYLGICSSAYRGCQNSVRSIRNVEDMKGLTFRTLAGQLYVDLFGAMGAATTSMAMSETFTALQQGLIQGEELTVPYFYQNSYYEVEKYATELNAVMSCAQTIMSVDTWEKLSESEKNLFNEACYMMTRDIQIELNTADIDKYYSLMSDEGVEVIRWNDLTEDERNSFINAATPLWDKYKENIDSELFTLWTEKCSAAWEKNGFTWTYTS